LKEAELAAAWNQRKHPKPLDAAMTYFTDPLFFRHFTIQPPDASGIIDEGEAGRDMHRVIADTVITDTVDAIGHR
jgi:hypothetical protein